MKPAAWLLLLLAGSVRGEAVEAHATAAAKEPVEPVPEGLGLDKPVPDGGGACRASYLQALESATRRAIDKLVANEGFRFTALQSGWVGFGPGGPARDGWRRTVSFGRAFVPEQSPSLAIQGLYAGSFRAECGVGRQVAQYATLYELFGARDFDAHFANDEIVIGTFVQLNASHSVLLGRNAGEFTRDGRAVEASKTGRFEGLPGFIFHVFDKSHLDDISNQAENFVVYEVSDPAKAALSAHRGFEHYNRINRDVWEIARTLDLTAQRIFERLLYEHDDRLLAAIAPENREPVLRMRALLDDPFYRGFRVYVHPKAVKPVGYHVARLLDRNPRTPFRIELGLHNLHTTLYDRWRTLHCR